MLKVGLADLTTTISRRDDREAYLRFTAPYRLGANYCFYTRRGSPVRIGSLDDLRDSRDIDAGWVSRARQIGFLLHRATVGGEPHGQGRGGPKDPGR